MAACSRHMAGLMAKHACKPFRKLLIRMKHELKDALSSTMSMRGAAELPGGLRGAWAPPPRPDAEVGAYIVGQDESTVRATLKELTGR